jgi:hypothetical protein
VPTYRGRCAATIENERVRVTVLAEGGHIAEIFDKDAGVNPLWTPPWPTIEPSTYDPLAHGDVYGRGADARLLAGIMGHNICLDIFGGPSVEEGVAGLPAHGDAVVVAYEISSSAKAMTMSARLPLSQIRFTRGLELDGRAIAVRERVESLCAFDRPIAWTQHVTLGPPFLEKGRTEFRASAVRSIVFESPFGAADYLQPGACFDWPDAPRVDGGVADLRVFTNEAASSAYTAHLMTAKRDAACFVAFSPAHRLALGYVWKPRDFPWMGIWEENRSRTAAPWNASTLTRGMEFGVSPFPEMRRAMVDRGRLFDTPTYRWLPAKGMLEADYWIVLQRTDTIPEFLGWPREAKTARATTGATS